MIPLQEWYLLLVDRWEAYKKKRAEDKRIFALYDRLDNNAKGKFSMKQHKKDIVAQAKARRKKLAPGRKKDDDKTE